MKKEILFSYFPKATVKRYQQLITVFGNLDKAWQADSEILKKTGWEEKVIQEFLNWKNKIDEEKITKILQQENIYCLTRNDENYPELLKQIYDPPFCLFVRGNLDMIKFPIAVVGTRKFTNYGQQITEEIVSQLAQQGITIISGLALGIDGIAHNATIEAGGKTIAVLGTGINKKHIYPAAHYQLSEKIIASGGALISEYPPGALPSKYSFPRRNRIIAGLSVGTLVIEAPEESGSLITAQYALDNNREVFAIPQNITSINSTGVNNLLKNGAHLITQAEDILEVLNLEKIKEFIDNQEIIPDSPTEAKILEILTKEPIHVDVITKKTQLDSSTVNATLTLMEMKGKVRNLGGMNYILGR